MLLCTVITIFITVCLIDLIRWLKDIKTPKRRFTRIHPIRPWHTVSRKQYAAKRKQVLKEEKEIYRRTTANKKWYWKILP